jgi:hypothetical protein
MMSRMLALLSGRQAHGRIKVVKAAVQEELEAWHGQPLSPSLISMLAELTARRSLRAAMRYDSQVRRGLK